MSHLIVITGRSDEEMLPTRFNTYTKEPLSGTKYHGWERREATRKSGLQEAVDKVPESLIVVIEFQ